jgi:uncharacterized protein YjaZ
MKDTPDIKIGKYSGFEPGKNIIWLADHRYEDIIHSLTHEANHWSQFLYLDADEENNVLSVYHDERQKHRIPFLERIII